MQVTETLSQGLKREYNVVISAGDLASKLDSATRRSQEQGPHQRLPPRQGAGRASQEGLWPLGDGRRRAGDDQRRQQADRRGERLAAGDGAEDRTSDRPVGDRGGARSARRPGLQGRAGSAAAVRGRRFRADIALERPVADVEESEVDERIAAPRRQPPHLQRAARGRGRGDGRPRHGRFRRHDRRRAPSRAATSKDIEVMLGSKTFIPGFEEALVGAIGRRTAQRQGDASPRITRSSALAGKTGEFDVTVKKVAKPEPSPSTTNSPRASASNRWRRCARRLRERIAADYARASREKVKRQLLDALADALQLRSAAGSGRRRNSARSGRRSSASRRHRGRSFADEEHDRRGGARRISRDRRAPRAARPAAGRSRRQGATSRSPTRR